MPGAFQKAKTFVFLLSQLVHTRGGMRGMERRRGASRAAGAPVAGAQDARRVQLPSAQGFIFSLHPDDTSSLFGGISGLLSHEEPRASQASPARKRQTVAPSPDRLTKGSVRARHTEGVIL